MSNFVDKKFNSFESYLRKNFKSECKKFEEFSRVFAVDYNAFFAFYLKILLEKLENIKQKSKPAVSESVPRKLRPGTRSSIPYPKDGLAAIKSGTIPDLNLHEMIKNSLKVAIDEFYSAIHKDKDLIKELEEKDTDVVKLDELYNIVTKPKDNVIIPTVISKPFNILDYLKEDDAKFIYPEIRQHMEAIHNDVVVVLLTKEGITFEDAIIQYGILPVMYTDPYIPKKYIFDFNNGYGVGLRISDPEKYEILMAYVLVFCELHSEYEYKRFDDQQLVLIVKHTST